ncbi:hypothetical protein MVEN_02361400 [Mycena venus]|uniref:Epidermal growth factor receptor-like transmembrane-juxtamembrane segment domain-containing protein n=1 Tax=Mycena venus TaxID=2733690 RepID=A0A8H6X2Y7_9AGAR|nr:hypothetical protein MVEN_02361400 [Mycena venus]
MSSATSSTPLRRIVVDDTDPAIKYTDNQWFPHDVNQLNSAGNLGPVWNSTTHSTSVNGATLSFDFSGTSIDVLGSIQTAVDTSGILDPSYLCLVDEIPISNGTDPTFRFPENNWLLCTQPTLLAGNHTLKITVATSGQPFYLDSLVYTPTPDVSYDGAVLEYTPDDPSITYSKGWQFYTVESTENITQTAGSQVTFNFHGTAAMLTGYVPQELPHNATTAKYSVDGGPDVTFPLQGLASNSNTTLFNIPMFSVSNLAPNANHKIVVTYLGDAQHTPLVVKSFYVTNSSTPSSSLANTASNSASGTASAPNNSGTSGASKGQVVASKHSNTGAIAGGVVGGLIVLAVLAFLFFFLWRRRRQQRGDAPLRPDPAYRDDPFGIDAATVGGAPAASIATGRATMGTAGAAVATTTYTSPSSNGDPFDPYAESGSRSGSHGQTTHNTSPTSTTPYSYPYVAVPHARTLSGSTSDVQQIPQGSVSAPSTSGTSSAPGAGAEPGALGVVGGPRTKAQEAALTPNRRVVLQRHQDSGVRLNNSTPSLLMSGPPEIVDLPPDYSRD